ncbi:hypothetical protein N8580_00530 [Akkermansiaceae bacterium]|nr:hypothetical protein [Akkermansiaceae bacterium]
MNKYLIVDIAMVLCCSYMVYGLGSYQVMPNISEASAIALTIIAMMGVIIGGCGIFTKVFRK